MDIKFGKKPPGMPTFHAGSGSGKSSPQLGSMPDVVIAVGTGITTGVAEVINTVVFTPVKVFENAVVSVANFFGFSNIDSKWLTGPWRI